MMTAPTAEKTTARGACATVRSGTARPSTAAALALSSLVACATSGASFRVLRSGSEPSPCAGRLVVYVLAEARAIALGGEPARLPIEAAQAVFGVDVASSAPAVVIVDDAATAYPARLSALPAGRYRAQAVLDCHHEDSSWQREPGNLYSDPIDFEVGTHQRASVELSLTRVVEAIAPPRVDGVEMFSVRSELLSRFQGHPVTLRAGVVFPREYDAQRAYGALYEVPYFGGSALGAFELGSREPRGDASGQLASEAFHIVLDSESGNGPTLFANSDNNGPWGDALVRELIPALEAHYPLRSTSGARLLRGHSSGGWASLWLQLMYPDVFGGAWSSSPDPVDFHRLQRVDIYADANMYSDGARDQPSTRDGRFTIRQENRIEEVLGPNNSSGQQWDSWQAVWGTRDAAGRITPLYDPLTGALDRSEAERYRRHDIAALLEREPAKYAPIFATRVHVLVGDQDSYFLDEAVERLAARLATLPGGGGGYVRVLPGFDHRSIRRAPAYQAMTQEMLAALRGVAHEP
jgi:S-formylglutathione hydrolase FrmB